MSEVRIAGEPRITLSAAAQQSLGGYPMFRVGVVGTGVNAELFVEVPPYEPESLGRFLERLSQESAPWLGARKWRAMDGELEIGFTCDRTGHVTINFVLWPHGAHVGWTLNAIASIDLGSLPNLCSDMRTVLPTWASE